MTCNKCNSPLGKVTSFQSKHKWARLCKECKKDRSRELDRKKKGKYVFEGYVYIIINKAWPGWCKIGVTRREPEERLNDYQIGSPFRDYELYNAIKVSDAFDTERKILELLVKEGYEKGTEWVKIEEQTAKNYLLQIITEECK